MPIHAAVKLPTPAALGAASQSRRQERQAMRELLYTVVRESMNKMGVLSSSYKFKVLSLDSRGRQYMVMMDVANLETQDAVRLGDIENLIAQTAKARHEILVTAVYWRVSEKVSTQLPYSQPMPLFGDSVPAPLRPAAAAPTPAAVAAPATALPVAAAAAAPRSPYEPLHPDEMAAFHQALAAASQPARTPLGPLADAVQAGPLPASRDSGFADTELDERAAPLSATQYGDL
ncbi:MAG: hypothetical protein ACT4NV_16645 [Rhodoferax sp.]